MPINPLKINVLPDPLPIRKLIGPSFIILGLGLGSGELILWPYLSANYGMGIIWGALLGITFQFFMNMEIERYALAHGESIFVGFARKLRFLPLWFIISTFVPWIWPGIIASSAKLLGSLLGIAETKYLAIGLLLLIGTILTLGPVLYKTVETLQKTLISIGVPSIFILAIILADKADWQALFKGAVGIGEGFMFLPAGISISSFLAALAYAGAGGNLNLAQSIYVREKGYGMGKYTGRITSLLTGKKEDINLYGSTFETTPENVGKFKIWWKNINIEHFILFWATGTVTILLLALLAYSTTHGMTGIAEGLNFVLLEGKVIGQTLFPAVGAFFILVAGLTLFGTQLTVFDATSRILSENLLLASNGKLKEQKIPAVYYTVLWAQIFSGIAIFLFGLTEPLQLLTTAAILNAFAMFIHTGLTLWTNMTLLDKALRPSIFRFSAMIAAFLFYGGFSLFVLIDKLF
ncbi:hypothetical protein A2619_02615 [candidate division WWE3 bacterium RIFOXYD1_FULL_39_9]|uniref:Uncharacterized protein n=1 Tax=candidate division WWE3 bacterium RIFOXYD1_FULL_39_9 TaxID=1802649 RepID=A0A1F4X966_UNCKA|nr:MAG: hypothetical protein A2619_02615 [candidate division WWE3 bacterium RIFOXYD1_FULL_39_9]